MKSSVQVQQHTPRSYDVCCKNFDWRATNLALPPLTKTVVVAGGVRVDGDGRGQRHGARSGVAAAVAVAAAAVEEKVEQGRVVLAGATHRQWGRSRGCRGEA